MQATQGEATAAAVARTPPGMDDFTQMVFWMGLVFIVCTLLHLLVSFVIWPKLLPKIKKPAFLVFPRIEVILLLTGFTAACGACAGAGGRGGLSAYGPHSRPHTGSTMRALVSIACSRLIRL